MGFKLFAGDNVPCNILFEDGQSSITIYSNKLEQQRKYIIWKKKKRAD